MDESPKSSTTTKAVHHGARRPCETMGMGPSAPETEKTPPPVVYDL
jgi:hypothetical protein